MERKMEIESQIVMGPDGTVLAATGGALVNPGGVRLQDWGEVSRDLREAGQALVRELHSSGRSVAAATVPMSPGRGAVQLLAIEALLIRREPTDMRALFNSVLAVMRQQAAAIDVSLHIIVDDSVPPVLSLDPEKVAWAVTSLVGSALRYVRSGSRRIPGGTINVEASYDPAAFALAIEVQDDGPGIAPERLNALFRRDAAQTERTSLGLMLVHDIIVAHGGRVDVRSNTDAFGHGTALRLTVPAR
jgi:signal transduction histidine kinase